jgi:hypothetical protein
LIGESGDMGEYGNRMERGDVGEFVGIVEHGATGWIRRRGAVREFVVAVWESSLWKVSGGEVLSDFVGGTGDMPFCVTGRIC